MAMSSLRRMPPRISGHPAVGSIGQAEAVQRLAGNLARAIEVPQPGDHDHIFPPGQDLVTSGELTGQAESVPLSAVPQRRSR